jgi:hypothetical protein
MGRCIKKTKAQVGLGQWIIVPAMHTTCSACSFCGKPCTQVRDLIASRRLGAAYICDQCIEICRRVLNEDHFQTTLGAPVRYRLQDGGDGASRPQALECSFCRRSQFIVNKLVSSRQAEAGQYICDRCVRWGAELLGKTEPLGISRSQRVTRWLKRRLGTLNAPIHRLPGSAP